VKRVAATLLALLAIAAGGVALLGPSASGSSDYHVDAIFDTAKGIIPGELVKIAGARVGTIDDVKLAVNQHGTYQARIVMTVNGKFAPFHSDATCKIKPEGLIAENFVQCDPGTSAAPALRANGRNPPTVPIARTSVPVNLLDLFNIFNTPVRDRLALVVSELGIGLAGQGESLNAILARANPTLALTRKAIGILNAQRAQVTQIVDSSDRLVAQLAANKGRVQAFVDGAAKVTTQTASHSGALAQGLNRLPALLAAAQPALTQLDSVAVTSIPIVSGVERAAPYIRQVLNTVPAFARAALPAFRKLGTVAKKGKATAVKDRPAITQLRSFAHAALPRAQQFDELLVNLRQRGFWESLFDVTYYGAAASARFDSVSHMLPAHLQLSPCSFYATTPTAGCSANYGGITSSATTRSRSSRHRTPAQSSPGAPTATTPAAPPPTTTAPQSPQNPVQGITDLTRKLLQGLTGDQQPPTTPQVLQDLTNFLLK
jgi:virulence factor Mce-like protein